MFAFMVIYGIIAFIAFALFLSPVFPDWADYSRKEIFGCAVFALAVGVMWPLLVVLLLVLVACGAYYSRKDAKDNEDDDDDYDGLLEESPSGN